MIRAAYVSIADLSAPVNPADSVTARQGDICVIVHPSGRYGIGEVVRVDAAGHAVAVDCGDRNHDVQGLRKFVECRCEFLQLVHRAFGWCDSTAEVLERLRPYTRRPVLTPEQLADVEAEASEIL